MADDNVVWLRGPRSRSVEESIAAARAALASTRREHPSAKRELVDYRFSRRPVYGPPTPEET